MPQGAIAEHQQKAADRIKVIRDVKNGAGYKVRTRDPLITNYVLSIYLEFPYIPQPARVIARFIVIKQLFLNPTKSMHSLTFLNVLAKCLHGAYTFKNGKRQDIQESH